MSAATASAEGVCAGFRVRAFGPQEVNRMGASFVQRVKHHAPESARDARDKEHRRCRHARAGGHREPRWSGACRSRRPGSVVVGRTVGDGRGAAYACPSSLAGGRAAPQDDGPDSGDGGESDDSGEDDGGSES